MLNNLACPDFIICPLFTSPLLPTIASLVLSSSFNALLKAGRVAIFGISLCDCKPQCCLSRCSTFVDHSPLSLQHRIDCTIRVSFPLTAAFNNMQKPSHTIRHFGFLTSPPPYPSLLFLSAINVFASDFLHNHRSHCAINTISWVQHDPDAFQEMATV
uniref:Uncharacterized protein n=1 Tax=Lactuca sativa TaxID=4236 RepID=A0A9R1W694_LACSA|nr:hypothetical protein LSAT_V11C300117710 [Lactuca sativa]